MINNIKLDEVNTFLDLHQSSVKAVEPTAEGNTVSVTVTNQMNKLINLVNNSEESIKSSKSLNDIKESIQNNTYHIDLDALSNKLIADGLV